MEQGDRCLSAHDKRHGDSHQKRSGNALHHDKPCVFHPVEETNEAEQKAGQQAVDGIGFQVFGRCPDHVCIIGKHVRQRVAMEKGNEKHEHAEHGGY